MKKKSILVNQVHIQYSEFKPEGKATEIHAIFRSEKKI